MFGLWKQQDQAIAILRFFIMLHRQGEGGQMTCFITAKNLAHRWQIKEQTLANWRHEGRGPPFIKVANRVRYSLNEIEDFENNQLQTASINLKWHTQDN